MCGRLKVVDDPITKFISDVLGLKFKLSTNTDVCPSQEVATLAINQGEVVQLNTTWGIKPSWAKRLLINARSETVREKRMFSKAMAERRCLVPCMGWYEWKDKTKYLFKSSDGLPFLMAGIWYPDVYVPQLVTITRSPIGQCAAIHSRMPLTIAAEHSQYWFNSSPDDLLALLDSDETPRIVIDKAA